MLKMDCVTLVTRQSIFRDASFDFEVGRVYGIVAVNGSGKTSLFRAIAGLLPLQSGSFQKASSLSLFYYESVDWLDGSLTGRDYLEYICHIWSPQTDIQQTIVTWQMAEYIDLPIRKYSLGMKQRLLIAMYFISQANILLMDEMTNGLDESNRQFFFQQLQSLELSNRIILLTSHYKEDLMEVCDCLLEIRDGQLLEVVR